MATKKIEFSVFTKPWRDIPIAQLADFVAGLGFDAIEFPVRPGYQVEPENVTEGLPILAKEMAKRGIRIASVAGKANEATMAACAEVGVPIIRDGDGLGPGEGYLAFEARVQKAMDAQVPVLEKYGITLGIQNHYGRHVTSAMGILHLIEKYDPKHFGAIWDPAHCALDGEGPELAADMIWSHLCMVNLKNAFWLRTNGPEAEYATWKPYWTSGRQGLASWPAVVAELKKRDFQGIVCLTAEYSDEHSVDRLIAEDIAFAKSLFV